MNKKKKEMLFKINVNLVLEKKAAVCGAHWLNTVKVNMFCEILYSK